MKPCAATGCEKALFSFFWLFVAGLVIGQALPAVGAQGAPGRTHPKTNSVRVHARATGDYALVDEQPAHPTRLLAKVKRGSRLDVDRELKPLGAALARRFSTPGLLLIETEPGKALAPVRNEAEAVARGKALMLRAAALRRSGAFEYVEPNYMVHAHIEPDDAAFVDGTLWGLRNMGSNGVAGVDIDATHAWDITTGSTNVIVAVIDTGIRYTHVELANQMWRNPGEIPDNGIDDDNDGYIDNVFGINAIDGSGDPMDDEGHGTHVAGTIGAAANDGHPHVGVAWQVRLMACKFLDASGSGYLEDGIKAIDFARTHGARIMNASWGGYFFSQALYDAIAAARDAGVLFVASAGNDAYQNNELFGAFPATYDLENIVSVAALEPGGDLAYFSNRGPRVHLAAPGMDIFSCSGTADDAYAVHSGTSMASPHVSGTAALLLAQYPGMPLMELVLRLLSTVTPLESDAAMVSTGGRLNAYRALTAEPDGILMVTVDTRASPVWSVGQPVSLRVIVSDVTPVTNATVIGSLEGLTNIVFHNDGLPPDRYAQDWIYSASFAAPPTTGSMTLSITASAPGKTDLTTNIVFTVLIPPPNDLFADRVRILDNYVTDGEGGPGTNELLYLGSSVYGSNAGASTEDGEELVFRVAGGNTVWWTFTAASNSWVRAGTDGSSFDTILGVYTGDSVSNLTLVARNDQAHGEHDWSEVEFSAYAHTTYQIVIDGFLGSIGDIRLDIRLQPPTPATIWWQTGDQCALPGKTVSFSVYADGQAPLRLQWQRNGTDIPGATNTTYEFVFQSAEEYGSYTVAATNLGGRVVSRPILLTPPSRSVVSVFNDGRYVYLPVNAYHVQESLWSLGHPVAPFTNILEGLTNPVVVIPPQQVAPLTPDLTAATTAALSNHVASGGILIMIGGNPLGGATSQLLNHLFGWSVEEAFVGGSPPSMASAATNTVFANAPVELGVNFMSSGLLRDTLPAASYPIYINGASMYGGDLGEGADIALFRHGAGAVVFLGWDWTDACPQGPRDGGWLDMFELAMHALEAPSPVPAPRLRDPTYAFGSVFQFGFRTYYGKRYTILASTNLIDWVPLGTNDANVSFFGDADANSYRQRFYRVLQE